MLQRPAPSEHEPYYARYIDLVPADPVLDLLESQIQETVDLLASVPSDLETHRYAPDRWSVREVVGHVIDVERTFAFRALSFARGDPARLPSFEQDDWARVSNAASRPLPALVRELILVRRSNVAMFLSFDDEAWVRRGVASGFEFTVRCMPFIIAGHELHHRSILRNRYGIG